MHLILTGATGLVGSAVLHHMLNTPAVTQISILSRRPVPQADGSPKAKVIIHSDFNNYPPSILDRLKGADGVVWAQGISQTKVSKEEYVNITLDYPLAAAKAFATLTSPEPFKFVYVSGEGATTTPGTFTPRFGTVKGKAEATLLALSKDPSYQNLKPYSPRPGGVDPTAFPEVRDWAPKQDWFIAPVLAVSRAVYAGMVTPTRELAKVLTDLAMGDGEPLQESGVLGEGRTLPNVVIRKLAGI